MKNININFKDHSIQHISIADALKLGLISEESPVYKFFDTHMGEDSAFKDKFKLVIYAGSEMIGPSIQVAELAGCITEEMMKVDGKYNTEEQPFYFLDIFSGSSATTIPSVKKFKKTPTEKYITIERIDNEPPSGEDDYLKLLFSGNNNIKCSDYKEINVFEKMREGIPDMIFTGKKYDLCIADPPHYLTLNFLIGKKDDASQCIADVLREKVDVFIIYYAHKEQRKLCSQIRYELSRYYKYVNKVVVGSEEMAVCYNHSIHTPQIKKGLNNFKLHYIEKYDDSKNLSLYWKPDESLQNRKGNIIILSGTSGIGKTYIINKIIEKTESCDIPVERIVSVTTREPRQNEKVDRDYYFVTPKEFLYRNSEKEFIKANQDYGDKLYATPLYEITDRVENGIDVIMDIGNEGIRDMVINGYLGAVPKFFILLKPIGEDIIKWNKCKEDYKDFNVKFLTFEYDIKDDKEKDFIQKQILHYVINLHKESQELSGKEIYSETKAFKYFYELIKDEKDNMLKIIKANISVSNGNYTYYLDIGAGTGDFTKQIIEYFNPGEICIIEPARHLMKLSKFDQSKTKIIPKSWECVLDNDLQDLESSGKFNLITSFNVNYSDWEFSLEKVYRYLDDEGIFILSTVDPYCQYSQATTLIKKDLGVNQQKDIGLEELKTILNKLFDYADYEVKLDVKFTLMNKEHDNYAFKFMFGKWMDEVEMDKIKKCLKDFYKGDEYSIPAEHKLFICKKRNSSNAPQISLLEP